MGLRRGIVAALLLAVLACIAAAEEKPPGATLLPLPCVFYSPETSLAGGAIFLVVTNSSPGAASQLDNVIRGGGFATLNGQAEAFASMEHFLPANLMRFTLDTYLARYPNKFFGIGPAAGGEEDYLPLEGLVDLTAGFRILPGLYAGPRIRFFGSRMLERAQNGMLEGGSIIGGNGAGVFGTGLRLTYEGRDFPISATRGFFADASGLFNARAFGEGSDFASFSLDARAYTAPFQAWKVVFAGQVYAALVRGDAPFQELPRLGGDELLRGYYDGRYRDTTLLALQAEIRMPIWWRFGLVLFGGAGQVAPDPGSFRLADTKLSGGLGIRFVLDPESGANIRVDLAWAATGVDFYFNLGEAF
jgi:hypothetical protein